MKVPSIVFLSEQQGEPESELQRQLAFYFKTQLAVTSAFLLHVRYGDAADDHVALCICGDGFDQCAVLENASKIFRGMFNETQGLDIVFLSPEQERRALKVGSPFYARTAEQI
jgi:SseB protein C-terminal domain